MNVPEESAEPSLESIASLVANRPRPNVLILDSWDPPVVSEKGNALLEPCGGQGVLPVGGGPLDDAAVLQADPDVIVVLASADEMDAAEDGIRGRAGWVGAKAAAHGDCYCAVRELFVDLPRVLATILHPDVFTQMLPPHSVRIAIPKPAVEEADSDDEGVA